MGDKKVLRDCEDVFENYETTSAKDTPDHLKMFIDKKRESQILCGRSFHDLANVGANFLVTDLQRSVSNSNSLEVFHEYSCYSS